MTTAVDPSTFIVGLITRVDDPYDNPMDRRCSRYFESDRYTAASLLTGGYDPGVRVWRESNRGLASFNQVLPRLTEPVVLLLNNDVKLDPDAVGPLYRTVALTSDALFAAPLCWDFDGLAYDTTLTDFRAAMAP